MKFNLPLFNRIRVKPEEDRRPRGGAPVCQMAGLRAGGDAPGPEGARRENQYWRFCLDHVREYNSTYNYFAGMSDDAVARYQKDAVTGHRPTWKMGLNGGGAERFADAPTDPFDVLREFGPADARAPNARRRKRARCATPSARRSTRSTSRLMRARPTSRRVSRSW